MVVARRKKYCCDASRLAYENYYTNQVGSGMPIYVGSRNQRGHGLGNVLGGLFKSVAPVLKKGLQTVARSGLALVGDVLDGKNLKDSAKSRAAQGIRQIVNDGRSIGDDGSMLKRGLHTAARSGLSLVGDVLEGKNFQNAAKTRTAQGIKRMLNGDDEFIRKRTASDKDVLDKVKQRKKNLRKRRRRQQRLADSDDEFDVLS